MRERIILDGREMQTKAELHRYLKEKLHLPSYYGNNLDALMDCLTSYFTPRLIEIAFAAEIIENLGTYGKKTLLVFQDAAEINETLEVEIKNRS